MQVFRCAGWSFFGLICLCASLRAPASDPAGTQHPTRQQLIGAWRLVRIEFSGPSGPIVDPFYQADSTGIIIYDGSGWMNVQIVAPHRPAFEVPTSRLSPAATTKEARSKSDAFDTYYAYFGSWIYDEAASVVTHHVESSLIAAETGLSYAQRVTLEEGRLIFTVRDRKNGQETVRRKVWERIPGGPR
jgi:hypothetical protein